MPISHRLAVTALTLAMLTACGPADPAKTDPLGVLRQNTIEKFEGYGDNAQLKGAFARGFGVGLQSNPGDFAPVTVNTTVDAALADGFYAAQLINQSELPEASDLREQLVSKFESR